MNWALRNRVVIKDMDVPLSRPEAFQLERGCTIWPAQDRTVVLLPLNESRVDIELIYRGGNTAVTVGWDPNIIIHFTELGLRVPGSGVARFIYVSLTLDREAERWFPILDV